MPYLHYLKDAINQIIQSYIIILNKNNIFLMKIK